MNPVRTAVIHLYGIALCIFFNGLLLMSPLRGSANFLLRSILMSALRAWLSVIYACSSLFFSQQLFFNATSLCHSLVRKDHCASSLLTLFLMSPLRGSANFLLRSILMSALRAWFCQL
jgi:hypothetical protein